MSEAKQIALVTGASAGLGAEFCRQLAQRCDVIIGVARRADRLHALAQELGEKVEFHAVEADLGTVEGVTRTVETLRQKGPVDVLVNNAGFSTLGKFDDQELASQQAMVDLHIGATLTLCRAAIPFMRQRGGGAIINVSSLGSFLPVSELAVYGATKAFLNFYSQSLQQEVADSGIRVQALCPGYTRTEMHSSEAFTSFDASTIPDKYWMESPEVVSASLAALAGDRVLVVPGKTNLALAQSGIQKQLDLL